MDPQTDEKYIKITIEQAKKAKSEGNTPIATLIVKDGEIIANGWSSVTKENDPSGHNDLNCIREACQKLNSLDLTGCTLYSTIEPCSMCLSCAVWAGISRVIFGAYKEDIKENPYLIDDYHAEDFVKSAKTFDGLPIEVKGGIFRKECADLLSGYKDWHR